MCHSPMDQFLIRHRLPASYRESASKHLEPLIADVLTRQARQHPLIVGINGCQGSGKTTLADYLRMTLQTEHELHVVCISLDDFYLGKKQRETLAAKVHPLLKTRGVPGTHDIHRALSTLAALKGQGKTPVHIPRFDKGRDDVLPFEDWDKVDKQVDVIILEGWCLGVAAQTNAALRKPVNDLEMEQDADGHWRGYVNKKLAHEYQDLFKRVDMWVMLRAPSFASVFLWRWEQEEKLANKLSVQAAKASAHTLMNREQLATFVQYFQRLTEHALQEMPARVDHWYQLDHGRLIVDEKHRS